jgi:hypothetical protein
MERPGGKRCAAGDPGGPLDVKELVESGGSYAVMMDRREPQCWSWSSVGSALLYSGRTDVATTPIFAMFAGRGQVKVYSGPSAQTSMRARSNVAGRDRCWRPRDGIRSECSNVWRLGDHNSLDIKSGIGL